MNFDIRFPQSELPRLTKLEPETIESFTSPRGATTSWEFQQRHDGGWELSQAFGLYLIPGCRDKHWSESATRMFARLVAGINSQELDDRIRLDDKRHILCLCGSQKSWEHVDHETVQGPMTREEMHSRHSGLLSVARERGMQLVTHDLRVTWERFLSLVEHHRGP